MTEAKKASSSRKLTFEESEVKIDKYEERPYFDALSDEHKKVLADNGQLPPKPAAKSDS